MNTISRFSLVCDTLEQAIKLNNRRHAYELIERLRDIVRQAFRGEGKEEADAGQ